VRRWHAVSLEILPASADLFSRAFLASTKKTAQYDANNLLLAQAYDEVLNFQLEEARLRAALQRIQRLEMLKQTPSNATPFSFPIIVDRLQRINVEARIIYIKEIVVNMTLYASAAASVSLLHWST